MTLSSNFVCDKYVSMFDFVLPTLKVPVDKEETKRNAFFVVVVLAENSSNRGWKSLLTRRSTEETVSLVLFHTVIN